MPCDGIAVLNAQVPLDLSEHLNTPEGQAAFIDYLTEAGVTRSLLTGRFYERSGGYVYRVGGITLRFDQKGITLAGNRGSIRSQDVTQLFNAAQSYASLLNQQTILAALTALGLTAQEFSYTADGDLSFSIEIGA